MQWAKHPHTRQLKTIPNLSMTGLWRLPLVEAAHALPMHAGLFLRPAYNIMPFLLHLINKLP